MEYCMDEVLKEGFHIIYGESREERRELGRSIYLKHFDYFISSKKELNDIEIGPISIPNTKKVKSVLLGNKALKRKGEKNIKQQLKTMDMLNVYDKKVSDLRYQEKKLLSVMMDIAEGKTSFIFNV